MAGNVQDIERRKKVARGEVCRIGDFCQSTYDAFNYKLEDYGQCKYKMEDFFKKTGLHNRGYKVTHYLYTYELIGEHSFEMLQPKKIWVGYVAVCVSRKEMKRLGRAEIVVALRGTATKYEWLENLKFCMLPVTSKRNNARVCPAMGDISITDEKGKVSRGFSGLFRGFRQSLLHAVGKNIELYRSLGVTDVSITVTGHSLGGALAVLAAHHLASELIHYCKKISVVTFAAPRVGNKEFNKHMEKVLCVKVLRVEVEGDIVPKLPRRSCDGYEGYKHGGKLLRVKLSSSPYLKTYCFINLKSRFLYVRSAHSLQVILHLVDGDCGGTFQPVHKDYAYVNKEGDFLHGKLGVPAKWVEDTEMVERYENRTCGNPGEVETEDHLSWPSSEVDVDETENHLGTRCQHLRDVLQTLINWLARLGYEIGNLIGDVIDILIEIFRNSGCGCLDNIWKAIVRFWKAIMKILKSIQRASVDYICDKIHMILANLFPIMA